jgi:hypothetical protein
MNIKLLITCTFCLFVPSILARAAHAQTQLANPSFEEDVANVGNPDGWEIGKGAQVKVVSGDASAGNRALQISDGYVAVYQNLQVPALSGQQISFSLDAKSASDNAAIGVRVGYFTNDNKWHDAVLLWNKPITSEYKTYTASRPFPANAKAGRLYIGIYRSDKKSTFYVDNIKLQIGGGLSADDAHHAITLARDAQYFLNRLGAINITSNKKDVWQKQAEDILQQAHTADISLAEKLDSYKEQITSLNTQLFKMMANDKTFISETSFAFARLAPDAIPIKSTFDGKVFSLRGEHQAIGIDIANADDAPQKIAIKVQSLPNGCSINWRRQVFTETWYTKGKTLISDPLTQLAGGDKSTFITIDSGQMARLFADIEVGENATAGNYPVTIFLTGNNNSTETQTLNLQIQPQAAPPQRMTNYAFGYINDFPISNTTARAIKDLDAHGVTDIEWAFMPPATFDKNGNLLKVDFNSYDKLLKDFAPSNIRLNTFWQPAYKSMKMDDGTDLKVLSPEWKNAIVQLMKAWIKNAGEHGVSADRVTVLIADEIHSHALESSPDESIQQYVEIAKLFHDKIPGLKNYLTLSFYAFPNDVKMALPYVDVILPHMPLPTQLTRNAPPTYNPRKAFTEEIYPMLFETRKQRGLEISSYHVAAGRSDDALQWNRFYPVLAAATGHTGIGYWAYNGFRGKTWDDTDGGLLDYNFVYNGAEKNPVCEKYNVTGETIVPSIRWAAVRAGLQDANIILALQKAADAGKLTSSQRTNFESLLTEAAKHDGPQGDTANAITIAEMQSFSQKLRTLYTAIK